LTEEGNKSPHKLDFGFVPIEHTREAWFFQKLKEPRIFDEGKIRGYLEKLKMPHFELSDAQAHSLTTFLLSQAEEPIPLEMERRLNLKEQEIEAGRLLVSKLNCQGCHLLDGEGGRIKEVLEDPGLAPPPLEGEGAKVQEDWLYQFLKGPSTIRPWLKYRMPTFGFHHDELAQLVKFFSNAAHQEIFFGKVKAGEAPQPSAETLAVGKQLFDMFQCAKCHEPKTGAALGASFLAPDLTLSKERLKSPWIVDWLKDPQALQPGTMMPSFFPEGQSPAPDVLEGNAEEQIKAIHDYLLVYSEEEPPA
jgi:mono/diheme cytochrome c family protein